MIPPLLASFHKTRPMARGLYSFCIELPKNRQGDGKTKFLQQIYFKATTPSPPSGIGAISRRCGSDAWGDDSARTLTVMAREQDCRTCRVEHPDDGVHSPVTALCL